MKNAPKNTTGSPRQRIRGATINQPRPLLAKKVTPAAGAPRTRIREPNKLWQPRNESAPRALGSALAREKAPTTTYAPAASHKTIWKIFQITVRRFYQLVTIYTRKMRLSDP